MLKLFKPSFVKLPINCDQVSYRLVVCLSRTSKTHAQNVIELHNVVKYSEVLPRYSYIISFTI